MTFCHLIVKRHKRTSRLPLSVPHMKYNSIPWNILLMSTDQQERGNFAVARHPFSLPGRWAWFEGAFKRKTCGAQRIEIGAEHAVMVSDPATYSVGIR